MPPHIKVEELIEFEDMLNEGTYYTNKNLLDDIMKDLK